MGKQLIPQIAETAEKHIGFTNYVNYVIMSLM